MVPGFAGRQQQRHLVTNTTVSAVKPVGVERKKKKRGENTTVV
jgi:hypothetical protein